MRSFCAADQLSAGRSGGARIASIFVIETRRSVLAEMCPAQWVPLHNI